MTDDRDSGWTPYLLIGAIVAFAALCMWAFWNDSQTPAPSPSAPDRQSQAASVATVGTARTAPRGPSSSRAVFRHFAAVARCGASTPRARGHRLSAGRGSPNERRWPWPWDALANCETEDPSTTAADADWQSNTGNGFYGGLQFSLASWRGVGGSGYPHTASVREQVHRGELLQSEQGWAAWPTCSQMVGLD